MVSSDQGACELFQREKESLIPKSARDLPRVRSLGLDFITDIYNPAEDPRTIDNFLLTATRSSEAVALLVDKKLDYIAKPVTGACFVGKIAFDPQNSNYKNHLASTLTRLVKNLALLIEMMADAGNRHALLLPLRNFSAPEIIDLQHLFHTDACSSDFFERIVKLVARLNQRKHPRRNSTYRERYFSDENSKLFSYGKEHHAQLATGAPHNSMCVLTGNFRFGARIPTDQHYNVTKEVGALTKISGTFLDCHDTSIAIAETTHLNMFSNDYHT